jgi:hypothetical protein
MAKHLSARLPWHDRGWDGQLSHLLGATLEETRKAATDTSNVGPDRITEVRRVIVNAWEQHLTNDERTQLDALRAAASERAVALQDSNT